MLEGWTITSIDTYQPLHKFEFHHDNHDGAPDGDHLCGTGDSLLDCYEQILEIENG